jgi:hypothetical protein
MTSAKDCFIYECLKQTAEHNGFTAYIDGHYISIAKADGHWPELTSGPIKQFYTADEATAWIEGVAWCKFIERVNKK